MSFPADQWTVLVALASLFHNQLNTFLTPVTIVLHSSTPVLLINWLSSSGHLPFVNINRKPFLLLPSSTFTLTVNWLSSPHRFSVLTYDLHRILLIPIVLPPTPPRVYQLVVFFLFTLFSSSAASNDLPQCCFPSYNLSSGSFFWLLSCFL